MKHLAPAGMVTIALLAVLCSGASRPALGQPATGGGLGSVLSDTYVDQRHLTLIGFGEHHSHYLQPWRAWLETVPVHQFLSGIGVAMPGPGQYDCALICRMLSEHGFTCGRVEIGWGSLNYEDDTKINGADGLKELLGTMRKYGIRPLILLNAHQGAPCPLRFFDRTVTKDAEAGQRVLEVDRVDDLVIGRSGPCDLTNYWAAEALVTKIDKDTVTLSKPLPKAVKAGTRMRWATLKYHPFSEPGSEEYERTIAGWKSYTRTVAALAAEALQTAGQDDLGFDMEVWNELTFGTEFLYINHYYDPKLVEYKELEVWDNIVKATADELDSAPELYAGATLVNGFGNTIPWTASSLQPARVGGICKHPYAGPKQFPEGDQKNNVLDSQGNVTQFIPAYLSHFPEYFASAIQTETMGRDTAPFDTDIYRTVHGRFARSYEQGGPCPVWITEVQLDVPSRGIKDGAEAMRLKAKAAARYFCFYLHKGVEKLFLFNAAGHGDPELDFATIDLRFLEYAKGNQAWTEDVASYVSPQLRCMKRITDMMKDGLGASPAAPRSIGVAAITDTHGNYQFEGDGTPGNPPLYDREVLAILPYQVNSRTFVIPYYVMTRDVVADLAPEQFSITLTGLQGRDAKVRTYDPLTDEDIPVSVTGAQGGTMTLSVMATDYPRLLRIEETGTTQ